MSERETAVADLAIHLHRKGVGCDGHAGDDVAVVDVMHRDDAYDIYDHLFPDIPSAPPAPEPPCAECGHARSQHLHSAGCACGCPEWPVAPEPPAAADEADRPMYRTPGTRTHGAAFDQSEPPAAAEEAWLEGAVSELAGIPGALQDIERRVLAATRLVAAALATPPPLDDLAALEARFLAAEGDWARFGSGMTLEQLTGASMVFGWLRSLAGDHKTGEQG